MTDTLAQSRAWATVSVPSAGVPNIVTIATLTKQVALYVQQKILKTLYEYAWLYCEIYLYRPDSCWPALMGTSTSTTYPSRYSPWLLYLLLTFNAGRGLCDGETAQTWPRMRRRGKNAAMYNEQVLKFFRWRRTRVQQIEIVQQLFLWARFVYDPLPKLIIDGNISRRSIVLVKKVLRLSFRFVSILMLCSKPLKLLLNFHLRRCKIPRLMWYRERTWLYCEIL